jgi:hemolysin III
MNMEISRNELISFKTHFFGFILAIAGMIALIIKNTGLPDIQATSVVYGLSMLFMFGASSMYHFNKNAENTETLWRKIDHLAIFVMIAGSYTPFSYIHLEGNWRWGIIITQWSLVALGIFFKFFYINAPRKLNTAIYLAMGWVVLIPIRQFVHNAPVYVSILLAVGGVFYTIGAVIYARKRPNPIPGFFGFHEIFHIFIILGAMSHFAAIFLSR